MVLYYAFHRIELYNHALTPLLRAYTINITKIGTDLRVGSDIAKVKTF